MEQSSLPFLLLLMCGYFGSTVLTVCRLPPNLSWSPQPRNITLRLSLRGGTCATEDECWGGPPELHLSHVFPQLCPLVVWVGDRVSIALDPSLHAYGLHLLAVARDHYDGCSTTTKSPALVEPEKLSYGVYYFITTGRFCRLGLRVAVVVRAPHWPFLHPPLLVPTSVSR